MYPKTWLRTTAAASSTHADGLLASLNSSARTTSNMIDLPVVGGFAGHLEEHVLELPLVAAQLGDGNPGTHQSSVDGGGVALVGAHPQPPVVGAHAIDLGHGLQPGPGDVGRRRGDDQI